MIDMLNTVYPTKLRFVVGIIILTRQKCIEILHFHAVSQVQKMALSVRYLVAPT